MAKHSSLTKAGVELGISESAVSQRVKSLEQRLGIKLYEARGGRVRLTPLGERTMEMAVRLFDELGRFEQAVSQKDEAYEMTICTQDVVLQYLLPRVVEDLSKSYPLSHLRLLSRSIDECIHLVRTNEHDVGIIPYRYLPKEVEFRKLASYPAFLLLPKGHPLVHRATHDFRSLLDDETVKRYPLIVSETQLEKGGLLKETFGKLDLTLNIGLEVGTFETLKNYVARGLGIAVVSGLCLTPEDHVSLEAVEVPEGLGGETTYGVILRHDKNLSPPLASFLQLLGTEDAG